MVDKQKAANGFTYLDHLDIILKQESSMSDIGSEGCIYPFNEFRKWMLTVLVTFYSMRKKILYQTQKLVLEAKEYEKLQFPFLSPSFFPKL